MKGTHGRFISFFRAFPLLILCASCIVVAQPPDASTFRAIPSPPPAGQPFNAVFGVVMHFDATGFFQNYAQHRIQGNNVDILFDTSCLFICQGLEPEYREYPFEMPALAAGSYNIRFVMGAFDHPSVVLGEFPLIVGGVAPTIPLPVGNWVTWALGFLLIAAALARFRFEFASLASRK